MDMILDDQLPSLTANWPYVLSLVTASVLVLFFSNNYFNHGLNKYPGPFLASFTDAWRFFSVVRGKCQLELRELHEQLGDVVRVGPNALSFSNPQAVKAIYGLHNRLNKVCVPSNLLDEFLTNRQSAFYPVQMQVSKGKVLQSLFGTQDQDYHTQLRRIVSSSFSMSSLIQYEPRVNETVRVFLKQTEQIYATPGKICDFITWLQYFAFDVITEITYSRRVGFVDNCEDVDGIIAWLGEIFDYQAPVGQMPFLDKIFVKNPIRMLLSKYGVIDNSSGTARFSRARMAERLREIEAQKASGVQESDRMDLLTMFLRAQRDNPSFFDDGRLLTMTTSIALAGSDTTAASLAAVFYHLLKNPRCYKKLNVELENSIKEGLISNEEGIITWTDAQKLPYLHACIQEAFRMHPAIGMILERVAPPQGVQVGKDFIPGGTVVGCNPWVIHYRREVFGDDVEKYRPERWLSSPDETATEYAARVREMNNTLFHFGGGSRTCLGKHIALLEMYKLIPSFLRRFDIKLDTDDDWDLHTAWFVKPEKFDVHLIAKEKLVVEQENLESIQLLHQSMNCCTFSPPYGRL